MNVHSRVPAIVVLGASMILTVISACAKNTFASRMKQQCPATTAWYNATLGRVAPKMRVLQRIRPSDPALANQIAKRTARDQAARQAAFNKAFGASGKPQPAALEQMQATDKANLAWLKPHIEAHGFPTLKQVGLKGVENAWLLVQHADRDPAFQAQVLAQLKPRLEREPFLRQDYAMLTDRVRLAQGGQQVFGTQFSMKHGRLVLKPTEDQRNLAKRRARMGLMPISDYQCMLRVMYHIPAQPKRPTSATPVH